MTIVVSSGFSEKGHIARFLTHNRSCRRISALLSGPYCLTHNISRHRAQSRLRSPERGETGQCAARKRYASEGVCFLPATAPISVKIYGSNTKSYWTNDNEGGGSPVTPEE